MNYREQAYSTLGLTAKASPEEIKQAYRKLAKSWHPDRFYNDLKKRQEAETKFKEIIAAYQLLKDSASTTTSKTIFSQTFTEIYVQKSDPNTHYQKGVEYAEQEDYQAAIEEFTRAIKLDNNFIKAYQYRGFLLSKFGYENRAKRDLRKAAELKLENLT